MDEPSRIERMVGEIVGLRIIVETLVDKQGGADAIRDELLLAIKQFAPKSDTPEGAERIKACAQSMVSNFPKPMDKTIS